VSVGWLVALIAPSNRSARLSSSPGRDEAH
jgi:hypothetical protein